MTYSEYMFRKCLKTNKVPYRAQYIIAPYVVDFYLKKKCIIIELDGEVHNKRSQNNHDIKRDLYLFSIGLLVLRFENKYSFDKIINIVTHCEDKNEKELTIINNRIGRINGSFSFSGYNNKALDLRYPTNWKDIFEAEKMQLRKIKPKTSSRKVIITKVSGQT